MGQVSVGVVTEVFCALSSQLLVCKSSSLALPSQWSADPEASNSLWQQLRTATWSPASTLTKDLCLASSCSIDQGHQHGAQTSPQPQMAAQATHFNVAPCSSTVPSTHMVSGCSTNMTLGGITALSCLRTMDPDKVLGGSTTDINMASSGGTDNGQFHGP